MNDIKIEGLDELIKAFAELGESEMDKLVDPATQAANIVLNKAKTKIHDVTGQLQRNLKITKPSKNRKDKYQVFAKVGFSSKAAHGVPLELGHRLYYFGKKTNLDVEPKPFLRPAADESKDEVINLMANAMNNILNEMGGLK